jgi:uncharacterized membrane protein
MMRSLVPNALWWFRWGAMFTFLTGWLIVISKMIVGGTAMYYYVLILTGGAMGTLMWYNVWFVIWPAQKLAIASAESVASGGEADSEAAARAPTAGRASRTNTLFSIPMLAFMGAAGHLQSLASGQPSYGAYAIVAAVLIVAVELNIFAGAAATQKPLATVSGTIQAGLVLTLVLFGVAAFTL